MSKQEVKKMALELFDRNLQTQALTKGKKQPVSGERDRPSDEQIKALKNEAGRSIIKEGHTPETIKEILTLARAVRERNLADGKINSAISTTRDNIKFLEKHKFLTKELEEEKRTLAELIADKATKGGKTRRRRKTKTKRSQKKRHRRSTRRRRKRSGRR